MKSGTSSRKAHFAVIFVAGFMAGVILSNFMVPSVEVLGWKVKVNRGP